MKPTPALSHRRVRQIATRLLTMIFVAYVLGGTLAAAERQTVSTVAPLYRAYRFSTQPGLNPEVSFKLTELDVPGLWRRLGVQLFDADDVIGDAVIPRDPFLCVGGVIHPFVNSVGGFGVMSGVVVDNAFYYSYSWGSGIHRSLVGQLTMKDGRPIQHESEPLFNRDMFVEKSDNGRVRVVVATRKGFNRWEAAAPLAWVGAVKGNQLKLVDDHGAEVSPVSRTWVNAEHSPAR